MCNMIPKMTNNLHLHFIREVQKQVLTYGCKEEAHWYQPTFGKVYAYDCLLLWTMVLGRTERQFISWLGSIEDLVCFLWSSKALVELRGMEALQGIVCCWQGLLFRQRTWLPASAALTVVPLGSVTVHANVWNSQLSHTDNVNAVCRYQHIVSSESLGKTMGLYEPDATIVEQCKRH